MIAVRAGEINQLGELFERHQGPLYGFFVRLTGDRSASEDLVQLVFYRILKYRHTYRDEGRFSAWIYHLARKVAADHFRRSQRRPRGHRPGRSPGRARPGAARRRPRRRRPTTPPACMPRSPRSTRPARGARARALPAPPARGNRPPARYLRRRRESPGAPRPQGTARHLFQTQPGTDRLTPPPPPLHPHLSLSPSLSLSLPPAMNCQRIQESFLDYQDGRLPSAEAAAVREHLKTCLTASANGPPCRKSPSSSTGCRPSRPARACARQFYAMLDTHRREEAGSRSPFVLMRSGLDRFFAALVPARPVFQFALACAVLLLGLLLGSRYLHRPPRRPRPIPPSPGSWRPARERSTRWASL